MLKSARIACDALSLAHICRCFRGRACDGSHAHGNDGGDDHLYYSSQKNLIVARVLNDTVAARAIASAYTADDVTYVHAALDKTIGALANLTTTDSRDGRVPRAPSSTSVGPWITVKRIGPGHNRRRAARAAGTQRD